MAEKIVRINRELKYQGAILKVYEDTVVAAITAYAVKYRV